MSILTTIGILVVAYVIGAIPSGLLIGKLHSGIDLREHGSKNIGFTNAWRVLGWKAALPVLILDVGKAWAATRYLPLLAGEPGELLRVGTGLVVLFGNLVNVFLGFRGGKGVATGLGVFAALAPLATGAALATFLVVVGISRYVSLGSICGSIALAVTVVLRHGVGPLFLVTAIASVAIIVKHRANIGRLLAGTENRIGKRRQTEPSQ